MRSRTLTLVSLDELAHLTSLDAPLLVWTPSWDVFTVSLHTLAVLLIGLLLTPAPVLAAHSSELVPWRTLETILDTPGTGSVAASIIARVAFS